DEITVVDSLFYILFVGYINLIETVKFADGTDWTYLQLLQHFIDVTQTDANDNVYGFEGISDTLTGGRGDDRLEGGTANDFYVFASGDGQDVVFDEGGEDRLNFGGITTSEIEFSRTSLDLIITVKATGQSVVLENQYVRDDRQVFAVEHFVFADRTLRYSDFNPEDIDLVGTNAVETITGSNFGETLDGRAGDDTLVGADGGDIYKFDVGYGHDVIIDKRVRASWSDRPGTRVAVDDQVQFGPDISRANVVFSKDGNDLVISIIGRDDTLRIRDQFRSIDDGVERFVFDDGTFLLDSDVEQILQITGGNRGDNTIEGSLNQPNTLDGRQGDDTLIGGNA
ncbi:MAG: calcium-binding protein, partial [Hyphomicrobiaceae bacterium]